MVPIRNAIQQGSTSKIIEEKVVAPLATRHLLKPILDVETVEDGLEGPWHLLHFVRVNSVDGSEEGSEDEEEDITHSKWKMEGEMKEGNGDHDKAYKPLVMGLFVDLGRWRWRGGWRENIGYGRSVRPHLLGTGQWRL